MRAGKKEMLFTPENAAKVMAGLKVMTRRICKEGEYLIDLGTHKAVLKGYTCIQAGKAKTVIKTKWEEGKTYAIQPGRGKNGIGRVKLLSIRREVLQDISDADIPLELGCLPAWPGPGPEPPYRRNLRGVFIYLWDSINPRGKKFSDNPEVWVLSFELV